MSSAIDSSDGLCLQEVVDRIHSVLESREDAPTAEQIRAVCHVLYASSLLKEEGRTVKARVILAPPEAFDFSVGPPDGIHAVHFETAHRFTSREIKSLSPAASYLHSVIAIWPDRNRGFRIWGILNTGPRWLNQVAGGRKSVGEQIPYPMIHLRDPGWLLFFHGHDLIAEWRGQEFYGPRMDVFRSQLLRQRFARHRLDFITSLIDYRLPDTLNVDIYAELAHLISLQFVKRIINLVRTSGHGGSLIFLPSSTTSFESAMKWINCKYSAVPDMKTAQFGVLLEIMIRRVGELCHYGASIDDAWAEFRNSRDPELDRMEESFFELARLYSDLMQVDGAVILDKSLRLIGFGGEIRVDRNVIQVSRAKDLEGRHGASWNVQNDGTRHRSVYRLCSIEPEVIGFVISQDSHVRMIANIEDTVVFWQHTMI